MTELIQKFFEKELTEAEEQALSELLKNSEEPALAFGAMAAQTYAQYGLPEPKRPGGGGSGPLFSRPWMKLLIFGLLTGGLAISGYFWHQSTLNNLSSTNLVSQSLPSQMGLVSKGHQKKAPVSKTGLGPIPPLIEYPAKTVFKLKILVQQPAYGPVTVQVLDSQERKARLLYTGSLKPGRWSFQWDGRLDSGLFADSGKYQIQVLAGTTLQKQDVLIKPLKKP